MEEVDGVGDGVLDYHAPGIAVDELAHGRLHLVGEQHRRLLMAQSAHGELPDVPWIAGPAGPEGMAHGDHRTARHAAVADDPVEIDPDEIGDEQEQFAELSVQALRGQIEFPDIGDRGTAGRRATSR